MLKPVIVGFALGMLLVGIGKAGIASQQPAPELVAMKTPFPLPTGVARKHVSAFDWFGNYRGPVHSLS